MKVLIYLVAFAIQAAICEEKFSTDIASKSIKSNLKCKHSKCEIKFLHNDFNDIDLIARKLQLYENFKTVKFVDCFLTDFPRNIFIEKLPSVRYLMIDDMGLQNLKLKDLRNFPKLQTLIASHNSLESLPQDLFDATPKIETLDFSYNRLSQIDMGSLLALKRLSSLDFTENFCVNEKFDFTDEFQIVRASQEIIQSCFPQNYKVQLNKRRSLMTVAVIVGRCWKCKRATKYRSCRKICKRGRCRWKCPTNLLP